MRRPHPFCIHPGFIKTEVRPADIVPGEFYEVTAGGRVWTIPVCVTCGISEQRAMEWKRAKA